MDEILELWRVQGKCFVGVELVAQSIRVRSLLQEAKERDGIYYISSARGNQLKLKVKKGELVRVKVLKGYSGERSA
jgi:hypothetical protein